MIEVKMPKLSEGMTEGKLLRWCVGEGTHVGEGDVIAEVETDKANMEIEALCSGVLEVLKAQPGEAVAVGETIALITPDIAPMAPEPERPIAFGWSQQQQDEGAARVETIPGVNASPLAQRIALQKGIDLTQVHGTGPFGRIMKEDVLAFARRPSVISIEPSSPHLAPISEPSRDLSCEAPTESDVSEPASYVSPDGEHTPDMFPEIDSVVGGGPEPVEIDDGKPVILQSDESPVVPDEPELSSAPTLEDLPPEEVAEVAGGDGVADRRESPVQGDQESNTESVVAGPGPEVVPVSPAPAELIDLRPTPEPQESDANVPVTTFSAGVSVNLSALKLAVPVLKSRSASRVQLSDDDSALTPIFLKAASLALAKVRGRVGAVNVAVRAGGDFSYPALGNCAELPLSELFDCYARLKMGGSVESDIFGTTAEIVFLNLASFGVEEFSGLPGDATAALALGAMREQPVSRSGRVERAHMAKATLCARMGEWTPAQGLDFLREFRQLVEHPVLLVGL